VKNFSKQNQKKTRPHTHYDECYLKNSNDKNVGKVEEKLGTSGNIAENVKIERII
jgi:hypothetical protein